MGFFELLGIVGRGFSLVFFIFLVVGDVFVFLSSIDVFMKGIWCVIVFILVYGLEFGGFSLCVMCC